MAKQHDPLIYTDPGAEKIPPARRRGLRTMAAVTAAAALMVLTLGILSVTLQGKGERYQKALTHLDRAEYAAAARELEQLVGFRDSSVLLRKLDLYIAASDLMARGEGPGSCEKAARIFESLGDFADAQAKASECRLAAGMAGETD